MSSIDIALEFLKYFCRGDIGHLSTLISENFVFKGPFVEFDSKESYLAFLMENPPENFQIDVLKTFESGNDVCLFYIFSKPGVHTPMAQYFKFDKGKIIETLLVFDSAVFSENE